MDIKAKKEATTKKIQEHKKEAEVKLKAFDDKEKKSLAATEEKIALVNKRGEKKIKEAKRKAAEATAKAE